MNTSILEKLKINKGSPKGQELIKILTICEQYSVEVAIGYFDSLLVLVRKTPYATFKGEVAIEALKASNFNPLKHMSRVILNGGLVLPLEVINRNMKKAIEVEFRSRTQILSPLYCLNMSMNYTELLILLCSFIFSEDIIDIRIRHGVANTKELIGLIQKGIIKNMALEDTPNSIFVGMYVFTRNHLNFSKGDVLMGNASNTLNDLYTLPNTPLNLNSLKRDIAVINNRDLKYPIRYKVLNPFNVLLSDNKEIEKELEKISECNQVCDICSNSSKIIKRCSIRNNADLYIRILLTIKKWKKKLQ